MSTQHEVPERVWEEASADNASGSEEVDSPAASKGSKYHAALQA